MAAISKTSALAFIELSIFAVVVISVPWILKGYRFSTTGSSLSWFFISILCVVHIVGSTAQLGVKSFVESSALDDLVDSISFAPLLLILIDVLRNL